MTQVLNQFSQNAEQGMIDLLRSGRLLSAKIDSSEGGTLVPGQAVKLVDNAGGVPKVIACAADTDEVFGFIAYNMKDQTFVAGDAVELMSGYDDVMYMTASAAIARGAKVMPVIASKKVATATVGKSVCGWALDKAGADGDLIRVVVQVPSRFAIIAATVAAIATADANDAATTQAMANECKATINSILTSLKAAKVMA